jgi:hypothetical protein
VSDAGLVQLKKFKTLRSLDLFGCKQVTDIGLAHVKDCKNLKSLWLMETSVTAGGVDELKKNLPKCRIEWDGGAIEPK